MQVHNSNSGRYSVAFARYEERAVALLTRVERLEYAALAGEGRRRDWLAGRFAAKHVVSGMLVSVRPEEVELFGGVGTAPLCIAYPTPDTQYPIPVSIAHRDGFAIAAAADTSVRVGVDIERSDAVNARHSRYFLSPREERAARTLGLSAAWVLKEAAWKALALSDATAFRDLELCFERDGALRGVLLSGVWLPAHAHMWTRAPRMLAAAVFVAQSVQ